MKAAKPFTGRFWQNITYTTPNLNELRTMHRLYEENLAEQDTDDVQIASDHTDDVQIASDHTDDTTPVTEQSLEDVLKECVELCKPLMQCISTIIVTLGHRGVVVCRDVPFDTPFLANGKLVGAEEDNRYYGHLVSARHYPAFGSDQENVDVVSVSGAGDRYVCECRNTLKSCEPI